MFEYKYYWRLDTNSHLLNKIEEDVFQPMINGSKVYGFKIILHEPGADVIEQLWSVSKEYLNSIGYNYTNQELLTSVLENNETDYNSQHYWNNFEICDIHWFRSELVYNYLNMIDKSGGIYLYRWGDAPIHSLAVFIFAHISQTYWYESIGYSHSEWWHCLTGCDQGPKLDQLCTPCQIFYRGIGICPLYTKQNP